MKRTFVRLSRAKSVNCWLRSGEKSSISKGSRPTCTRVIANCKIDFRRHVFTAHHGRADEANRLQCVRSHLVQRCSRFLRCNWPFDTARPSWAAAGEVSIVSSDPFSFLSNQPSILNHQLLLERANRLAWKRAVRCNMVKNGTTHAGTSTRGNRFIALEVTFPITPLIPWNSPEDRTPMDTATTKSTIPRIFHITYRRLAANNGLRTRPSTIHGAVTPIAMSPIPAGKANSPGKTRQA